MANKVFSKKHNEYFSLQFIIRVYKLYLQYCEEHCLSPEYLSGEFDELLEIGIPDDFITKLLYHAELQKLSIEEHILK